MIKLYICIPTYNRREYLRNAINSVIKQINDKETEECVEIVISDNCSTDNTKNMISEIRGKHPNIKIVYSVTDKNYGADRNYIRAVSLANGEYCWFLGSDDEIAENSLKYVLNEIKEGHTIYLSDKYEARLEDMKIFGQSHIFKPKIKSDTFFEFKNEKDWDYYINRCNAICALFSYLSVIVFKRNIWNEVSKNDYEPFIGSAYVHVAILLFMLKNHVDAKLKYLSKPIAVCRYGNDSFYINCYGRTMLDIDGYIKLSNIFEDSDVIKNDIRLLVKKELPLIDWRLPLLTSRREFIDLIEKLKLIGYKEVEIENIRRMRRWWWLTFLMVALNKICKIIGLVK